MGMGGGARGSRTSEVSLVHIVFQGYTVRPGSQTNKRAYVLPGSARKGLLSKLHRTGPAYLQLLAPRALPSLSPLSAVLSGHLVEICSKTVKAGSEDTGTRLHSLTELSCYICHFFPLRQP